MAFKNDKYYKRDLSWLRFNHRVLQEAADARNPLYERLKFLAIFSSNLDEFFKVRISDIRKIKNIKKPLRKKLITKPNKLLSAIKKEVDKQQSEFGKIFSEELVPELAKEHIYLISEEDFNESQKQSARDFYTKNKDHFHCITTKSNDAFIENEALYLVGLSKENKLIWIEITEEFPRFYSFPNEDENRYYISFLDDVLRLNLREEYGVDFYSIKISRDAELYIDNEYSGDLLSKIKEALPKRETGQITRMLIDKAAPDSLNETIMQELDVNHTDLVLGGAYHNFKDFFKFPNPTHKDFSFEDLPPVPVKSLHQSENIFASVDEKDHLLCFPYESFEDVIRFIETSASDEFVTRIQITLYRISKESAIAKALLKAQKAGKEVFVFIETKARFDEENNILWGSKLEAEGAKVMYSYAGIKVHSKILHVTREIDGNEQQYAYIGTGNFNESTSKIYTDYGLLTSDERITTELSQVFKVLKGELIIPRTKHLLVSPFSTRSRFEEMIEKEIKNAEDGEEAYIIAKMNSLQDRQMIKLLYKANNAGVKIRLLVRGICCLVPGIENRSEHIEVTSIVDRFLEHGRIFIFANGGKEKMYMGSADWMTRNLDHRIEVITPILDQEIFKKLKKTFDLLLEDQVKARTIDKDQTNKYICSGGKASESAQHLVYKTLLKQN
jgi:polyphosphate kinase